MAKKKAKKERLQHLCGPQAVDLWTSITAVQVICQMQKAMAVGRAVTSGIKDEKIKEVSLREMAAATLYRMGAFMADLSAVYHLPFANLPDNDLDLLQELAEKAGWA